VSLLIGAALFLADGVLAAGGDSPSDVDPTTGHGPEWGKAAPIGLLVIVLMCVAVYFLVKSLNRNLKKVPESFDDVPVPVGGAAEVAGEDAAPDGDRDQTAQHDPGSPPSSAGS
jgi:hypothetical protein